MLPRCGRRRWKADCSRGSARSGSLRVAGVSVSARAPRPLAVRLDCACASSSFWGEREGGCVPGHRVRVSSLSRGVCVCVLVPASPDPSPRSSALLSPSCLLPPHSLPKPPTTCAPEKPNSSRSAPRGEAGAGPSRRGGRRLLPPCRLLPLPRLTLPPWEGCLEGSGRPKPKPRSASYDQLGVCLLLPRAQVWEQASVQNMSEGGDGQGRGVGEDHHQRGRHAT